MASTKVQKQLSQAFQEHMQREMENAAERFWQEYNRKTRRSRTTQRKQRHPPSEGYVCNICGKEGGQPDSHWIQFCPEKNKEQEEVASSTEATIADSEADIVQHHSSSPVSLPEFVDEPNSDSVKPRPSSR